MLNAAFDFITTHLLHVFQPIEKKVIFSKKMRDVFELGKITFSLKSLVEKEVTVSLYWLRKVAD